MRTIKIWVLAAILICSMTMVFTSCSDKEDNPEPSPELPKSYNLIADEYKEDDQIGRASCRERV